MKKDTKTNREYLAGIEDLQMRLEEAEEALRAIRNGKVDPLVASKPYGDEVFTLNGAEHPYRVFVETINEGVATLDFEGIILYCNNRFAEMLKISLERVIGSSIYRFIPPADTTVFESVFQRGGREDSKLEISLKRETQELVPVCLCFSALHGHGVPYICMVAMDLAERKQADEALRTSKEEATRWAQENATVAEIGRIISSTLNIDEVYQRFAEEVHKLIPFDGISVNMIDYEKDIVMFPYVSGIEVTGHQYGDTLPLTGSVVGEVARTRTGLIIPIDCSSELKGRYPDLSMAYEAGLRAFMIVPLISKDRVIGTIHFRSAQPEIYSDRDLKIAESIASQIAGAVSNAQLFAEQKHAEEALRMVQERLKFIVSQSPAVIFTNKASGDFALTSISDNVMSRFGYEPQAFLEDPGFWANHIHPEDRPRVFSEFPRLFEQGTHTYEYRFRHKNGTYRWVHDEARLVRDMAGNPREIIAAGMDITEGKLAEEKIQEALREKEVLLKEIHHRVKNNLQVISSLLNLRSRYVKEVPIREVLKESQNRVKSMALVHEKLYRSKDFAKIDFGEYTRSLVTDLFRCYGAGSNSIDLTINAEDVLLNIDTAIPCGLIVNELVSNSLKHAFPAREQGKIRIELHSNYDHHFDLIISDNGVGFPKKLDFRNTESLGLQLVNSLVHQLEGTIELDNREGTAFKIAFAEMNYKERG